MVNFDFLYMYLKRILSYIIQLGILRLCDEFDVLGIKLSYRRI